ARLRGTVMSAMLAQFGWQDVLALALGALLFVVALRWRRRRGHGCANCPQRDPQRDPQRH
ncbi:MAG TPA: hypothetical protein VK348_15045, partial [Planctomycetota bacterium]|nr:hypothetical protein [Planctomycetota bacterium]